MAYIGTNNLILQFKQNVEKDINDGLTNGIPPIVVKLVLETYLQMSSNLVDKMIQKEDKKYREQLAAEQNAVDTDVSENTIDDKG